jgi:hypothetical protein
MDSYEVKWIYLLMILLMDIEGGSTLNRAS